MALGRINLASLQFEQKKYVDALENLQKAKNIIKLAYGKNHPDIIMINNNIGSVYQKMKDFDNAQKFYEKALKVIKTLEKNNTIYEANILLNIAQIKSANE